MLFQSFALVFDNYQQQIISSASGKKEISSGMAAKRKKLVGIAVAGNCHYFSWVQARKAGR
jgi:hypothetical protein